MMLAILVRYLYLTWISLRINLSNVSSSNLEIILYVGRYTLVMNVFVLPKLQI